MISTFFLGKRTLIQAVNAISMLSDYPIFPKYFKTNLIGKIELFRKNSVNCGMSDNAILAVILGTSSYHDQLFFCRGQFTCTGKVKNKWQF